MTKKTTKRSLAMSILSLVLCLAMLIGSTYAWFSDKAETSPVTITAGNLDVEVVKGTTKKEDVPNNVTALKNLFTGLNEKVSMENWEPGMMVTSDEFKIANLGTLALQYKINVEAKASEGAEHDLFDRIKYKVVEKTDEVQLPGESSDLQARLTFWNSIEGETDKTTGKITAEDKITANPLVIVLFWEPDQSTADDNVDNTYNIRDDYKSNKLTATFQVNVFATQTPEETDSFGNKYDNITIAEAGKTNYTLGGGELAFTENQTTSENPVFVYGSGTVNVDAEVKSTFAEPGAGAINTSLVLGNGTEPADIVLKGKGTVKKVAEDQNYAVCIQEQTNVTIESGTYEGIIISAFNQGKKAGVLTIKGGKIIGGINIENNAKDGSKMHIVIEDINAVYEEKGQESENCAYFEAKDKENVQLPEGFELVASSNPNWLYVQKKAGN